MENNLFRPRYYQRFKCIADRCCDSCCRSGWEIPLDDDTYRLYKSCGADDIDENLTVGSDGDRIFRLKENGDCPYLDESGLCRLYTLTDGRLGEICQKYPRFTEEYDGFIEEGISMSCPEAQRLILSASQNDYDFSGEVPEEELLGFLHKARARAFEIVFQKGSCEEAAARLMDFGDSLQQYIDDESFDKADEAIKYELKPLKKLSAEYFCFISDVILKETDILYPKWRELLQRAASGEMKSRAFDSRIGRKYLAYLVFRFFLKAVNYEDIRAVCEFIAASYCLVTRLPGDFYENARLFSKEIEHDAANFDAVLSCFECW